MTLLVGLGELLALNGVNEEHDDFRWIDRGSLDRDFLWPGERRQLEERAMRSLGDEPSLAGLREAA